MNVFGNLMENLLEILKYFEILLLILMFRVQNKHFYVEFLYLFPAFYKNLNFLAILVQQSLTRCHLQYFQTSLTVSNKLKSIFVLIAIRLQILIYFNHCIKLI